jgi:hypothetical protein
MRQSKRSKRIAALALVSALSAAVRPQPVSAQAVETGFKGIVRIRVVANSGTESPRLSSQVVWYDFLPGESKSFMATAGHNGDLCRTGAAGPLPFSTPDFQAWAAKEEASAQYVWHFDVRMIEVMASSITFELSWQRTSRVSPDERLRYSQRLTLRQGDARPVDLVHGASGSPCSNVTIFAEADIADDPSLVGKTIEWDLWASTGPKTTSRQRLRSVQGEAAEFKFEPLAEPGSEPEEWAIFYGTVTGRVRVDGSVDVAIDVRQMRIQRIMSQIELSEMFRKRRQRGADPLPIGKSYTAKPGEAVKIVVPTGLTRRTTDPATGRTRIELAPPVYPMSLTLQAQVR